MMATRELNLNITGMHCASCSAGIERDLSDLKGVETCRVNLATRTGRVEYDADRLKVDTILARIEKLGFGATVGSLDLLEGNRRETAEARRRLTTALVLTVPLMILAMWPMVFGSRLFSVWIDGLIEAVIAAVLLFLPGRSILLDAFNRAMHRRVNMNSLIAMGTLTAFGWSLYALYQVSIGLFEPLYFESAGMIITLILVGRYMEARARRRAGNAIEELIRLRPTKATALINNVEVEIEAAAVQPGMILLVRPGDKVPVDGEITEGRPVLDESLLTGESLPVERRPGDGVIGGSINGNVAFWLRATSVGEDSFVAGVIRLVSEAQGRKAPIQNLADRIASVFVPVILGLALLTGVAWYFLAPESGMMVRSVIAVLIIACPCALGLATPAAVLVGTGRGAREGIIIKGGDILEALSTIDAVIFDKTGTLTKGVLEVVSVKTFGRVSEPNLIRMVGSVENQSDHPVGRAVVALMKDRQIQPAVVREVEARPGFGLVGEVDGRRLVIGSRALMEEEQISFGPALLQGEKQMERGRSVIFVALDGQVAGLLALADQVRGDARELIDELKISMKKVSMISGDNRKTATGVARTLGLDDYEAEIKPAQKQLIVESYRRAGFQVAMVGDGINDAPALAAATVGVAIGGGTQVAMETADAVLVKSDLAAVSRMFHLARLTMRTIRQNLFWAFFYNLVAIPVAAGALYPLTGFAMSPILAAMAMSFSSVFVVFNSVRLGRIEI